MFRKISLDRTYQNESKSEVLKDRISGLGRGMDASGRRGTSEGRLQIRYGQLGLYQNGPGIGAR